MVVQTRVSLGGLNYFQMLEDNFPHEFHKSGLKGNHTQGDPWYCETIGGLSFPLG